MPTLKIGRATFITSPSGHVVVVQSNVWLPIFHCTIDKLNLIPTVTKISVYIIILSIFFKVILNVIVGPEIQLAARALRNQTLQTEQFFKRSHQETLDP